MGGEGRGGEERGGYSRADERSGWDARIEEWKGRK